MWPTPRLPFIAAALEQAFWLASLAVVVDAAKRDRVIEIGVETCLERRALARA